MGKYQGWANWATWNVALWIGNEYNLYRAMRARRPFTAKSAEAFVRGAMPGGTQDMRGQANPYKEVDWVEIADDFNDE